MHNIQQIIGGKKVGAISGKTFNRIDPFTGVVASTAPASGVEDVKAAVAAAQAAFPAWSRTTPAARRALLLKAADIMESKVPQFSELLTTETGGTAPWAGFNTIFAAGILREAASITTQIQGEIIPSNKPGTIALATRQAAGVCVGIAPWNAPVILGTRAVAVAIACGNTAILKASEACPGIHVLIGEVLVEAGLPDGVINVITNAPEDAAQVVEALIAAPEVRRVNFTGSTKVGRIIGELCGRHLKPALLELGGKAPLIVLEDADIDAAVNAAVFGCYMNMGQICMSTERLIVHEKIADEFVAKLSARAANLPYGDPRGHVVLGSLVNPESAKKMQAFIDDALAKGATLAAGGQIEGSVVAATLLDHVKEGMRSFDEESFGPVKPVIRVKDEEEAIRIANDTEYGLSSAVFSRDIKRAMDVAARIESGICHINGPTVSDEAQMPFGGVKASGYGRFGGKAGIDAFTELRWITIEDPNQHYPI